MFAILGVLTGWMYLRSRQEPIDPSNVNDDWEAEGPAARRGSSEKAGE